MLVKLRYHIVLIAIFLSVFSSTVSAQGDPDSAEAVINVDSIFTAARQLAYDGQYDSAEVLLDEMIAEFPDYLDIKLFRIRQEAWEKQYDSVDVFSERFFKDSVPKPEELLEIRATSAWWEGDTAKALERSNDCLESYDQNLHCHTLKLKVREKSLEYDQGLFEAESIVDSFPNDSFIPDYIKRLKALRAKNGIGVIGHYDIYTNSALNRLAIDIEYQRKTKRGPLFVRFTPAQRFNRWGFQGSSDFYWTLHEKFYLYLGGSVSNDAAMFPIYRVGLEPFFTGLPNWEFSLGARYLEYNVIQTWLFTGSVTRYLGDHYGNLRAFVSTRPNNNLGLALVGAYRYYVSDQFNFIEAKLGYGANPDNTHLDATFVQAVNSRTYNASLGGQKSLGYSWLLKGWVAYEYLVPQNIANFSILSLNAGLIWRF